MTDLGELYQSIILDHNRAPRNHHAMVDATGHADGRNPLCGDTVTVWVRVDGDTIADVSFVGSGCAISKASASLMTTTVKGKTRAEADAIFAQFHDLVTGHASDTATLGRLAAFGGVSRFPMRVKCASLAWHALRAALDGQGVTTTE
jgi:nitrogen fixation NifU-like protein